MSSPIPLDQPTTKGPPAIALHEPGASCVVGIVNVGEYQQKDFDTGEMEFWPDGGPKLGKVVTGLVVSTSGSCSVGRDHDPVAEGDLVTFWCEGSKFYTYRDAVTEHGTVNVGDVMFWRRIEDAPPKKAGMNPAKMYEAKLRHPEARDGDLVNRCVVAYNQRQARPVADAGDPFPSTPTPAPVYDDEPEF